MATLAFSSRSVRTWNASNEAFGWTKTFTDPRRGFGPVGRNCCRSRWQQFGAVAVEFHVLGRGRDAVQWRPCREFSSWRSRWC